ncbi:ankyrin repeat domain-containing protein [Aspergillus novofumigatus IBT 16806]|uniref:Ankyrin repeat protein n=1 Tax=Aspergillus novofumigatus (strain IBT 16806) TaxID=1392255 RepID=A0A2I1BVH8_ASPN1|nr:ankyrin repeat protein [Aspergillus novofumigatus IBT 16806]PKX89374.1 ankyrin repeat protein [Aspergillus novofumigatus IBT 16806]
MSPELYKISPTSLKYLETPELWKIIESDGELAPHEKEIVQKRFIDNNIYTVPSARAFKKLTGHSSDPIADVIRYDRVKTLKSLVDAGLNLQHYSRSGWKLLGLALASKAERISRYIIDTSSPEELCGRIGATSDCEDGTFLSLAATWDASIFAHLWDRVRHLPSKQRRLSDDAMYLFMAPSGETAWHAAAECANDLEFLKRIAVRSPESINERTVDGATPLMYAAAFNHFPEIVVFLLSRGADPALVNAAGNTAASLARRYGSQALVDSLTDEE